MRNSRYLFALVGAGLLSAGAGAADPIRVELRERVTVGTAVVTVGDVALVSGGDADLRARVAVLDLAEFKIRDRGADIGRRSIEYRLQLAGIEAGAVRVTGAERVAVVPARRPVTVEEVVAAARAEVLRQVPESEFTVELTRPVVVKLPEVPVNERVTVTAKPVAKPGAPGTPGRVQVDMTIVCGTETLLAFAVHLEVKKIAPAVPVAGAPGTPAVPAPAGDAILVRPMQKVEVVVQSNAYRIVMIGEAQQAGRMGQTISVMNLDAKKLISAKVVGPGKLEIELGGTTP